MWWWQYWQRVLVPHVVASSHEPLFILPCGVVLTDWSSSQAMLTVLCSQVWKIKHLWCCRLFGVAAGGVTRAEERWDGVE